MPLGELRGKLNSSATYGAVEEENEEPRLPRRECRTAGKESRIRDRTPGEEEVEFGTPETFAKQEGREDGDLSFEHKKSKLSLAQLLSVIDYK